MLRKLQTHFVPLVEKNALKNAVKHSKNKYWYVHSKLGNAYIYSYY